jgi:hypothetical protein
MIISISALTSVGSSAFIRKVWESPPIKKREVLCGFKININQ